MNKLKNYNGKNVIPYLDKTNPVYVGCVLDATNANNRYTAMQQLFDIAAKRDEYPDTDFSSEFTAADCGIVCKLPLHNPQMFSKFDFDILFAKNADVQTHPASITKVASLVTGLDCVPDLQEIVTISSDDISAGSGSTFYAGDKLTMDSILCFMMMESSNTCSNTFAHYCGRKFLLDPDASDSDSMAAFISAMNTKAVELGCTGSAFDTPHGMTRTNLTTAHDMLLITINACRFPWLLQAWGYKSKTCHVFGDNARDITLTKNKPALITDYIPLGDKNGALSYSDPALSANSLVMIATNK